MQIRAAAVAAAEHEKVFKSMNDGTFMKYECSFFNNTATLSTRTHLAPKPAQNTLNHV